MIKNKLIQINLLLILVKIFKDPRITRIMTKDNLRIANQLEDYLTNSINYIKLVTKTLNV